MPDGSDGFVAAVGAAAKRRLGKSGARVRALAADLLLLACGVRVAVLWDFWPLDAGQDGFEAKAGVSVAALLAFLEELRGASAAAAPLCLVQLGPSHFLAHRSALAAKLERDLEADLGELVAVDAALRAPRPCEACERAAVVGRLGALAAPLARSLRSPSPRAPLVRHDCAGALLVSAHGWLLDFPVVYAYVGGDEPGGQEPARAPSASTSCLGGAPLSLCKLTALMVTASAAPPPHGAAEPHVVCSFSLPAAGDPLARPGIASWWATMRSRLAGDAARPCWRDARLETSVAVQDSVVL